MYEHVLLPTDGSSGAAAAIDPAIDPAIEFARLGDATLHVLYVLDTRMSPVDTEMDHDTVEEWVDAAAHDPTAVAIDRVEAAGLSAVRAIRHGAPDEVIRRYIAEAEIDLVVMGTHGRTASIDTSSGASPSGCFGPHRSPW